MYTLIVKYFSNKFNDDQKPFGLFNYVVSIQKEKIDQNFLKSIRNFEHRKSVAPGGGSPVRNWKQ